MVARSFNLCALNWYTVVQLCTSILLLASKPCIDYNAKNKKSNFIVDCNCRNDYYFTITMLLLPLLLPLLLTTDDDVIDFNSFFLSWC